MAATVSRPQLLGIPGSGDTYKPDNLTGASCPDGYQNPSEGSPRDAAVFPPERHTRSGVSVERELWQSRVRSPVGGSRGDTARPCEGCGNFDEAFSVQRAMRRFWVLVVPLALLTPGCLGSGSGGEASTQAQAVSPTIKPNQVMKPSTVQLLVTWRFGVGGDTTGVHRYHLTCPRPELAAGPATATCQQIAHLSARYFGTSYDVNPPSFGGWSIVQVRGTINGVSIERGFSGPPQLANWVRVIQSIR
jgi:hypothetical protein